MSEARKPRISTRKEPKQTRSRQLVSDILIAAGRVLAREGAHRFTVARVAEEAGVSVGSFYQYFPNKEAILFRLQSEEWIRTRSLIAEILSNKSVPSLDRLRSVVLEFVRSECEEAQLRRALDDAVPMYRTAPEAIKLQQEGKHLSDAFFEEALPNLNKNKTRVIAEITMMCMKSVGKQISEMHLSAKEVDDRAHALADMFCAYLNDCEGSTAENDIDAHHHFN